jgi:hypothetical protein
VGSRCGRHGRCDPPVPGASNAISRWSRIRRANGSHMPTCAPIPVISSSGTPSPSWVAIRTRRPPTSTSLVII